MRKFLTTFLLFLFVSTSFGQQNWEWVKLITSSAGDVNCEEVTIDENGNLYVVGNFNGTANFDSISKTSTGSSDGFITKLDKSGNFKWVKTLQGLNQDAFTAITYDNGFLYIGGYFTLSGNFDTTNLTAIGGRDIVLMKLDTSGNTQWTKSGGSSSVNILSPETVNRIEVNNQEELIVSGTFGQGSVFLDTLAATFSQFSFFKSFFAKFTTSGNIINLFVPQIFPERYEVAPDSLGFLYSPLSTFLSGNFNNLAVISKLDSNNNLNKTSISINGFFPFYTIDADKKGNSYIGLGLNGNGLTFGPTLFSSSGGQDFFVSRFDNQLNLKFAKQFGGSGNDEVQKIIAQKDGFIISGFFNTSASFDNFVVSSPGQSAFVAKVDSNGTVEWVKGKADGVGVFGKSFAVDASEQVFLVGDFLGQINFDGTVYSGQAFRDGFIAKLGCKPNQPDAIFGDTSVCLDTAIYTVSPQNEITHIWTLGSGGTILNNTGDTCTVVWNSAGKHNLEVIASNSCGLSPTKSIEVRVKSFPTVPVISGDTAVCLGSHLYEITNQEGALYQWQNSVSAIKISLGNNRLFTWNTAQFDTISVSATNSCGTTNSIKYPINVIGNPTNSPTIAGNNSICAGQNIFRIQGANPNNQYNWSAPGSQITNNSDSAIINFASAGNYTISAFEVNQCGNGPSTNFNVLVNEAPNTPTNFTGDLTPCVGVENYGIIPQSGATYNWSLDSGGAIIPLGNSASVLWNTKGKFNITVQGSNQCGNGPSLVKAISVDDIPNPPTGIIGEDSVCLGSQQYLVNLPNSNAIWNLSGGGALNTSKNTANINWVSSGSYILSVSASNSCGTSNSINKIIFVDTLSSLISTISGSNQSCIDTSNYGVSFQSGITYSWSLDSGGVLIDSANTASVIWQEHGIFNLKLQTNNGCKSNKLIEVIGNPNPLNSIVGDSLVCSGNSAYSFTPNTGITYNWQTTSNTNIISLGGNAFVNWTSAGLDTIIITGTNQCGTDTVYTLPIKIEATPIISNILGDSLLCKGNIINYQTNFDSSYAYTWQTSGGSIGSSGNSATVNWLDSGIFTIQVSASNLCGSSNSFQKQIEVLSKPKSPSILTGNLNPCLQTEVYNINSEPNQTYQWILGSGGNLSFNNDSAVVNWTQSGNQNLVVIPQSNCGQGTPKTFVINVNDVPQTPTLVNDSVLCKGQNTFQVTTQNTDSVFWNFSGKLNLDTALSIFNINLPDTGNSQVIITPKNVCGFGDILNFNLQVIDVISPSVILGDTTSCINQTSFATPLDTSLNYVWNLTGGGFLSTQNNAASVNWLAPGSFDLELQLANKCGIGPKLSKTVLVSTVPPQPILTQGDASPCLGNEIYETFQVPNGKYNWIIDSSLFLFDTTRTLNLNVANLNPINLQVFSQNQCGNSDTLNLNLTPIDVPSFKPTILGDSVFCVGSTAKFKANSNGTSINWNSTGGGLLNPNNDSCFVTATQQGNFILVATSSNKCGFGLADSINFEIQDIPQIPSVIQGNLKTCVGAVDSFFTNAPNADSIIWSINGGGQISGNQNFSIANWQNAGTFLLEAKPVNFCGTGSPRVAIVETSKLPEAPTVVQGDTFVCKGSTTYIVATTTPASYIWKTNHVFNILPKGNTAKIDFDTTGNFNLKIISSNYCGVGDSTQLSIEVLGVPNKPTQIFGDDSLCFGSDLQFLTKKLGETYLWNLTSGGGLLAKNDSVKLTWTTPGDHQLSVQAQNVCGTSSTLQKTIHVDGFPTQPSFTVQNKKSCVLDTAVYFANPGFGQSLSWFVDGGSILDQKDDSVKIVWEQTGDKILSAFSKNLCGLSAPSSIVMVINKLPQLNSTLIGERQVCINTTQEYQIASTDLTSYNWQFNKAQNSAVDNFAFAKWTESGFDTISVTTSNYCGLAGPLLYPIEILDPPTQPLLAFENGFLKSNVNQEFSIQWYFEGKRISGAQDSIYEPTRPGYYQIGISNVCDSVILSRKYLIGFDTENIGFVIYPNPARNEVNVEIPLNINWEAVQVLNSVGQVMYEETNKGFWKLNFDLEFLPQGFYLVRIKSEFGLHTKKFTKS